MVAALAVHIQHIHGHSTTLAMQSNSCCRLRLSYCLRVAPCDKDMCIACVYKMLLRASFNAIMLIEYRIVDQLACRATWLTAYACHLGAVKTAWHWQRY